MSYFIVLYGMSYRTIYIAIQYNISDNGWPYVGDNRNSNFINFRMRQTYVALEEIGLVRQHDFTVNIKFWCERNLLYVKFFTDEAYALFLLYDIAVRWNEYDIYIRKVYPKRVRIEKQMLTSDV